MKLKINLVLLTLTALSNNYVYASDDLQKYGVQKHTNDTHNTRTDTYTKEVYKSENHGYGVYGSSTREFKNSDGERGTSANEKPNSGSKGAGVYMDF